MSKTIEGKRSALTYDLMDNLCPCFFRSILTGLFPPSSGTALINGLGN